MSVGSINGNVIIPQIEQPNIEDANRQGDKVEGQKPNNVAVQGGNQAGQVNHTGIDHVEVKEPEVHPQPEVNAHPDQPLLVNPGHVEPPHGPVVTKAVLVGVDAAKIEDSATREMAGKAIKQFLRAPFDYSKCAEKLLSVICEAQIDSQCTDSSIEAISKENFTAILSTMGKAQINQLVILLSDKTTHQKIPTLAFKSCESFNETDPAAVKSAVGQINGCYNALLESLIAVAADKGVPTQLLADLQGCTEQVGMAPQLVIRFIDSANGQIASYFDRDCKNLLTTIGQINSLDMASTMVKDLRSQLSEANQLAHPDHQSINDSLRSKLAKQISSLDDAALTALLKNLQSGEYYAAINAAPGEIKNEDDAIQLVFADLHYLATQEQLDRATKARKSDHVYGLEKIDFEMPSFSGWQRFTRALGNFFKSLFTLGIAETNSLEHDAIIAKAKEFAKNNGELLWQLRNEGYYGASIFAEVQSQFHQHGWTVPPQDICTFTMEITSIMVEACDDYYKQRYQGLTDLPATDPRSIILKNDLIQVGADNGFDLSGLSGKELVTLKETILLTLNDAYKANHAANLKAITRDCLERAATKLQNEKLGLIPAEPKTRLTNADHAQMVLSQVGGGITNIHTMLVAATNFAADVRAEAERVYEEAKQTDPDTPAISEGQLSQMRREILKGQLAKCSSAQLLALAKEVNRQRFNEIKQGVTLANEKFGTGGQVGRLAAKNCRAAEAVMDDVFQAIKAEVTNRQLETDLTWSNPLINSLDDISPRVAKLVGTFAKDANEVAVGEFGQRALGILDSIKNNTFMAGNQLGRLLSSFVAATGFDGSAAQLAEVPSFFENTMLRELHGLKGSEVLELFKSLLKPEMLQYRLHLADSKKADDQLLMIMLNSIEAGIHMEIADRALVADKSSDLSGGQLSILAGQEKRTAKEVLSEQSDNYLRTGDQEELAELNQEEAQILAANGITKAQFDKVMAESDLTINISGSLFFGDEPVFADQDGNPIPGRTNLKNIFELHPDAKGESYLRDRLMVEHAFSKELAKMDQEGIDPSNHPISAAINIGQGVLGAAPFYANNDGQGRYCCLVLKDEVKKRATCSAADSFYSLSMHLDANNLEEKLTAFFNEQVANPSADYTKGIVDILKADNVPLLVQMVMDATVNHNPPVADFGMGTGNDKLSEFLVKQLGNNPLLKNTRGNDQYELFSNLYRFLGDKARGHVTSGDHLERLLPHLSEEKITAIKTRANDPDQINIGTDYIEMQVFGGVDIARDVKEMVVYDVIPKTEKTKIINYAQKLGIPLRFVSQKEQDVTKLSVKQVEPIAVPAEISQKDDSMKAFKKDFMSILDLYAHHEVTFDPQSLHGRAHICRVIIYANAFINYLTEQGLKVDRYGLMRAIAMHDAGRRTNGPDVYEGLSKDLIAKFLTTGVEKPEEEFDGKMVPGVQVNGLGINDQAYVDKISGLVLGNVPTDTLEGIVLHSVDSVDIVRVTGTDGFDRTKMEFGNQQIRQGDKDYRIDHAVREQLISEAQKLNESVDLLRDEQAKFDDAQERLMEGDDSAFADKEAAIEDMKKKSRSVSNEAYFEAFEQEILQHPEKYPFLAKYYRAE